MKFDIAITTPLPALVFLGVGLVAAGWIIASTWQLVWLKRLRARNLRIVADLRRLTSWAPPTVRREPGNWHPRGWPAPRQNWGPERGAPVPAGGAHPTAVQPVVARPVPAQVAAHSVATHAVATHGVASPTGAASIVVASRAAVAPRPGPATRVVAPRPPANELWSEATPGRVLSRVLPQALARAHIPEQAQPRRWTFALPWLLAVSLVVAIMTARMTHWAAYAAHRLGVRP